MSGKAVNRDDIREFVGTIGLDTVSQIDANWSVLRLKVV
jgi:hypothetical protein